MLPTPIVAAATAKGADRLAVNRLQWPPLACGPGASVADNGHIVDGCQPKLLAALEAILQSISSVLLHGPRSDHHPNPAGVTSHVGG
jgi:hypothetical protein